MKGFVWSRADVRMWIACAMCFAAGFLMREVRVEAAVREPPAACAERAAPVAPAASETPRPVVEAPVAPVQQPKPIARSATRAHAKAERSRAAPVGEFKRVRSAIVATPPQHARASADKTAAREALSTNDFAKALRVLTRDVPKLAEDPEHLSLLAVSLVGVGRFQEAGVIYRALVERDAHDARATAGLALCEQRLAKPPDSRGAVSKSPPAAAS